MAIINNAIMDFAATLMEIEDNQLNEVSKKNYRMISFRQYLEELHGETICLKLNV